MSKKPQDKFVELDTKRRNALSELDDSTIKLVHVRACVIAGLGFLTSAYDLFVINLVSNILGYAYYSSNNNSVPTNLDTGIKTSAAIGNVIGQLFFGWMADRYGRKKVYGIELSIMIAASAGTALAANSFSMSMFTGIIFWRIILGIGVGGDYPLSAVLTSEFATKKRRGTMMALVFAMQGFGILFAALITMITLKVFESHIKEDVRYLDYVWRIVVAVGAIPAIGVLYFRITNPESPRYIMDVCGNIEKGAKSVEILLNSDNNKVKDNEVEAFYLVGTPQASWKDFREYFGKWHNAKILISTCVTWFAIDVAFYGISFNQGIIMNATTNLTKSQEPYQNLFNSAIGSVVVTVLGTIPGYWCSVLLIDRLGRRFIQLMGFSVLTILYLVIGFSYTVITTQEYHAIFVVLFIISMFFTNFGPNTTTFIIPGEVFPTRYRCLCHGISAASGKIGAIVSQIMVLLLKDIGGTNMFFDRLLEFFALAAFIGFLFSFLVPETGNKSLEENSNEMQEGFIKSYIYPELKPPKVVKLNKMQNRHNNN
ncbi:24888_t:CDS:2, partial [Cetraspora pellucida]